MVRLCLVLALVTSCARPVDAAPHVLAGGGVRAEVSEGRATVDVAGHEVTLRATTLGRGEDRTALGRGAAIRDGDEVRTTRAPGVVEWWRPLPGGLEHGVDLAERPRGAGPVTVELEVRGLRPETRTSDAVALLDARGRERATYAGLVVLDAGGRELPAWLDARGGVVAISFDDTEAIYPVVVDPMIALSREATLPADASAFPAGAEYGRALALTADADRLLVGVPGDLVGATTGAGSVRVWSRSGTTWTEEAVLSAPTPQASARFGDVVAVSDDGTIAIVGSPSWDAPTLADAGAAYVFVRTGTSWTLEATLSPDVAARNGAFGTGVALSGDGLHALIGEPGFSDTGRAIHFVHGGTSWTRGEALIVMTTGREGGAAVALSGDGSRAIVGAPRRSSSTGAGRAVSFTRVGTTWTLEADLPPPGFSRDRFGEWVALSADGATATAGGPTSAPAVYTLSASTWTRVQTVGASPPALSADGSSIAGLDSGRPTLWSRTGATWTIVGYEAMTRNPGDPFAIARDGSRIALGLPGFRTTVGEADVLLVRPAGELGDPCVRTSDCLSDFCADGVCCNVVCFGSCMACSAALTGGTDGTCAALSATVAPTQICRDAGTEPCDGPEVCEAGSTTCPPPSVSPAGTPCREAASACDAVEVCDGVTSACPADAPAPVSTVCRPAAGACDVAELCDGVRFDCPAADVRVPSGLVCRSTAGMCDVEETCDGVSPACPDDVVLAAGITCSPSSGSECDLPDVCNGTSGVCPPTYRPATEPCGEPAMGVCDAADHCAGTSADCVSAFLADVQCRASTGGCDPAELCTGDRADCPPDQFSPEGTVCRASVASCDPAESCDGTASACPLDETMCMDVDSGVVADAGMPPTPTAGCSCRATRARPPLFVLAAVALVGLMVRRRR